MPAIPVAPPRPSGVPDGFIAKQGLFERGDRLYMQTPVQRFRPSEDQIEEFAFSKAVLQSKAPNDNIVWLRGQYVEADNPNANGAQWRSEELAIKSLTPMLMPVTVMHDPRTAVGTIADVKLLTPENDNVQRARIDTVLALWAHRFPEAVNEAEVNAERGTLMQSMECYSPWYECSACGAMYHKLPGGAEQAQWCDHLKASNPSAGFVDLGAAQTSNASRILGDVTFTGTGLIFGTRGAQGAYSEAYLSDLEDEVARMHSTYHTETATTSPSPPRSASNMALVQIEQSELDTLRQERDTAREEASASKTALTEAERKVTELETAKAEAETAKAEAEQKVTTLEEQANRATLKDTRMKALGGGFVAKLGDFTKERLEAKAATVSDEDWDAELKVVEEATGAKRDDQAKEETPEEKAQREAREAAARGGSPEFSLEEIANAGGSPSGGSGSTAPSDRERASVVGTLGGLFSPTTKS